MVGKNITKKKTAKKIRARKPPEKKTGNKSGQLLKLDSVLVINDAREIYAKLDTLIQSNQNILIDASSVEVIDTAVLQLLVAFIKKTRLQNTETNWENPSDEFVSRAEKLGLVESLGIAEAVS